MHDTKYRIIKEVEVLSKSASGRVKVAAAVTVRYGEELGALLPSVLDRAFKGEL